MKNILPTQESLKLLSERVQEFCLARFNNIPDSINIDKDGEISVIFVEYYSGDFEEEEVSIELAWLTEDLDKVREIRIQAEKEKAAAREIKRQKDKEAKEFRDKRNRKAQYLKLKKEFEV